MKVYLNITSIKLFSALLNRLNIISTHISLVNLCSIIGYSPCEASNSVFYKQIKQYSTLTSKQVNSYYFDSPLEMLYIIALCMRIIDNNYTLNKPPADLLCLQPAERDSAVWLVWECVVSPPLPCAPAAAQPRAGPAPSTPPPPPAPHHNVRTVITQHILSPPVPRNTCHYAACNSILHCASQHLSLRCTQIYPPPLHNTTQHLSPRCKNSFPPPIHNTTFVTML